MSALLLLFFYLLGILTCIKMIVSWFSDAHWSRSNLVLAALGLSLLILIFVESCVHDM